MTTTRLLGWAATVLVAGCVAGTHRRVADVKVEAVKGKTYPQQWAEIRQLDSWNPARFLVRRDGSRGPGLYKSNGFGWFLYRTFGDPGPMAWILRGPAPSPVSDEVHRHFTELADACQQDQSFGRALKLLFGNIHLFGRSVPWTELSISQLKPLSANERRSLRQVAHVMQGVMSSRAASGEVRSAARLIVALTGGDDFAYDAVDTDALAVFPLQHPDERLTAFLSQYYLFHAFLRRGNKDEALEVARTAVREYGTDRALRDLTAYQYLLDYAADAAGDVPVT